MPNKLASAAALTLSLLLIGCGPKPLSKQELTASLQKPDHAKYPPRPTVAPPPFRIFHTTDTSITLVTKPDATDDEIASLIWQLRDAAHTHSLDKLKIDQKLVDARKPTVWFHIYRGPKCAAEKYADGQPPCGPSYHAAGDYTFGGGPANPQWDSGLLIHDEDHETHLWNSDAPYVAANP